MIHAAALTQSRNPGFVLHVEKGGGADGRSIKMHTRAQFFVLGAQYTRLHATLEPACKNKTVFKIIAGLQYRGAYSKYYEETLLLNGQHKKFYGIYNCIYYSISYLYTKRKNIHFQRASIVHFVQFFSKV
jgi:hypothetical protein